MTSRYRKLVPKTIRKPPKIVDKITRPPRQDAQAPPGAKPRDVIRLDAAAANLGSSRALIEPGCKAGHGRYYWRCRDVDHVNA